MYVYRLHVLCITDALYCSHITKGIRSKKEIWRSTKEWEATEGKSLLKYYPDSRPEAKIMWKSSNAKN